MLQITRHIVSQRLFCDAFCIMSRLRLLLDRVLCKHRLLLFVRIYKKPYSHKDKRNTEKLTHVENHILLEHHLWFLDELNEETHTEASNKEGSDKESSINLISLELINYCQNNSKDEVAEGFV